MPSRRRALLTLLVCLALGVLVLNVAIPPARVPAPAMLPSMRKLTVPVGVPAPGATALSVMVKVTLAPGNAGLAEDAIAPEERDWVIVRLAPT